MRYLTGIVILIVMAMFAAIAPIQYYYSDRSISEIPHHNDSGQALESLTSQLQKEAGGLDCKGYIRPLIKIDTPDGTLPDLLTDLNLVLGEYAGWNVNADEETRERMNNRKDELLKKWGSILKGEKIKEIATDEAKADLRTFYSAKAVWFYLPESKADNVKIVLTIFDNRTQSQLFQIDETFMHPDRVAEFEEKINRETAQLQRIKNRADLSQKILYGILLIILIYAIILAVSWRISLIRKRKIMDKLAIDIEKRGELVDNGHFEAALKLADRYLKYFPDDMDVYAFRQRLLDFTNNDPKRAQEAYVKSLMLTKLLEKYKNEPDKLFLPPEEKQEIKELEVYHPDLPKAYSEFTQLEMKANRLRELRPKVEEVRRIMDKGQLYHARKEIDSLYSTNPDIDIVVDLREEICRCQQEAEEQWDTLMGQLAVRQIESAESTIELLKKNALDYPALLNLESFLSKSEESNTFILRPVGKKRTIQFLQKDTIVIGRRDDNWIPDIDLDNRHVSRRHLRVSLAGGNVIAEDLKSSGGSFLDGKAFVSQKLDHDATLTLARVVDFSLSVGTDADGRPAALLLSGNDTDYLMLFGDTMLGITEDRIDIHKEEYSIFSWKKVLVLSDKKHMQFFIPEAELKLGEMTYSVEAFK